MVDDDVRTDAVVEPDGVAPVAAESVGSGPARAGRWRWIVGGGVALAAVAGLALAAFLLGSRPLPEGLGYLPADSVVVVELHPELPGDERQHLGNFLAHFPGFADQSTLDAKIDESLDRLIRQATGGEIDYGRQVKPLTHGPVVVGVSLGTVDLANPRPDKDGVLVVATLEGDVTCDTIFGSTTPATTHAGVEIVGVDDSLACAVDGGYLLLGTSTAIAGGLDVHQAGSGVDTSDRYRTARTALDGDQLATFYVDGRLYDEVFSDLAAFATPVEAPAFPDWAMGGLRVVDDAIVVDVAAPPVSASNLPSGAPTIGPSGPSRFAPTLPADTLALVEVHGVGALLERNLAQLRADPAQAEALSQIDAALSAVGGAANIIDWMEDVGVAVMPTDDGASVAILIRGSDAEAAAARYAQIRNLLVLASTGTDITLHDSDHGGVTVTTVDLGDLSGLFGEAGLPADLGTVGGSFSMAVRDDLVILGIGDGAVERVLDVESNASLATAAGYTRAIGLAGSTGQVQGYVALDGFLALGDALGPWAHPLDEMPADARAYAEHLAGLAFSSGATTTTTHGRFVLTVK